MFVHNKCYRWMTGDSIENHLKNCHNYRHRCTRVEYPGEGVPEVFAKIPGGGVEAFRENFQGGPPILGLPVPLPPSPPVCTYNYRGHLLQISPDNRLSEMIAKYMMDLYQSYFIYTGQCCKYKT